jgi:hypothetical protein
VPDAEVDAKAGVAILSAEDIARIGEKRRQEQSWRLRRYDTYDSYLYRDTAETSQGGQVVSMDPAGRAILRPVENLGDWSGMSRRYVANLLRPIVEDETALKGQLPSVQATPPGPEPAAKDRAEKLSHWYHSTYDLSKMSHHHADIAHHLAAYGDGCYLASVIADQDTRYYGRVAAESIDPHFAFPRFYGGWRRFELYDLILAFEMDPADIWATYQIKVRSNTPENTTVWVYLSRFQKTTVVGKGIPTGQHVEWNLYGVPAVWVFNKAGGRHCQSDIAEALGLQDMYDFSLNLMADGAIESTFGMTVGTNRRSFGEGPVNVGPGELIWKDAQGKLEKIPPTPPSKAAHDLADLSRHDLFTAAGTTPVRQEGEVSGSIQTGKAIQHSQGPQATRLDLKLSLLKNSMEDFNRCLAELQEKAPLFGDRSFEIWGRHKGKDFRQDFTPTSDIDGWYENVVSFDRLMGVSYQGKVVQAMQGVAGKLHDRRYGMELIGIEDPEEMQKRVRQEELEDAQMQAEAQKMMASAQGPTGEPQPRPDVPNVTFPGAHQQPGRGPQPSFRPPQLAQASQPSTPPPPAGPQGVTLKDVRDKLLPFLQQLKGQVFAIGDLALEGLSQAPQLRITQWEDYRYVHQAVPEASVKQQGEATMPSYKELVA